MIFMVIFKAYDIRGKYPLEVNEDLYYSIGKCIHIFNNPKKVIVGTDMRSSSNPLKNALIKGLIQSGIEVLDMGLASTPMVYQATSDYEVDLGLIITASHNSKEYNGLKLCKRFAVPISWDSGIKELKQAVEEKNYAPDSNKLGGVRTINYNGEYLEKVQGYFEPKRRLKVVLDAGNGMGGLLLPKILLKNAEIIELYTTLDGNFPNHEANPIKEETLEDLKSKVLEEGADIGLATDGDADRIGVIDSQGNFVSADLVVAFLTEYLINEYPDEEVFSYDLRSSHIVKDIILQNGKKPVETRVGHSFIKELMRKEKSFFSGELSGHFYFWFDKQTVYDSAARTSIELLNALSQRDESSAEIFNGYRKYFHSPETNFEVENKQQTLEKLKEYFSDAKIREIDGITIEYDNWWCNIRASNTENVLRLNLEAKNKELYDEKYLEVQKLISQ